MYTILLRRLSIVNGKTISCVVGLFAIGLALGNTHKKHFEKNIKVINKTTIDQYMNRLTEFFFEDINSAKSTFFELLDMGLNPSDCFEITIAKQALV